MVMLAGRYGEPAATNAAVSSCVTAARRNSSALWATVHPVLPLTTTPPFNHPRFWTELIERHQGPAN